MAVPSLYAVHHNFEICGVLTGPDRPQGRGRLHSSSPVKCAADELGLQIIQPERLSGEIRTVVASLQPDILVVVAFGKIFGPKFLSRFPEGGVNLHPSLLPAYRGPAPIPAAILNGETTTGDRSSRSPITTSELRSVDPPQIRGESDWIFTSPSSPLRQAGQVNRAEFF